MDANQHVNNVKYIGWILEVPFSLAGMHANVVTKTHCQFAKELRDLFSSFLLAECAKECVKGL